MPASNADNGIRSRFRGVVTQYGVTTLCLLSGTLVPAVDRIVGAPDTKFRVMLRKRGVRPSMQAVSKRKSGLETGPGGQGFYV